MAINYTYPVKAVPTVSDNVLIIDNEDTTNPRSTKTATIQSIVNLASGGGGGVTWGSITGTLANQNDLQSALDAKQNTLTLTTNGISGAATLVGSTLNIPQYAGGGGGVTSVTGTSPVVSSGGTTPDISMAAATTSVNGYLTSTDWTTFNNKLTTVSGDLTPVLSGNLDVNGNSIVSVVGGGDISITPEIGGSVVLDGIKYPKTDGTGGQVLQTNGAGELSFVTVSGSGTVTEVTANVPLSVTSGTTTPDLTITQATTSVDGYLTSTDWNTFNNKLSSVGGDAAPVLSGNLNVNGNSIVSSSGNISITPDASGNVVLNGISYPKVDGTIDQVLKTDGAGQLSFTTVGGGVTSVTGTTPVVSSGGTTPAISMAAATTSVDGYLSSTNWNTFNNKLSSVGGDTAPILGGDLDVNGNSIVSSGGGDISITPSGLGNVITSNVTIDGIKYPQTDGTGGQVLQTNGAGQLSFATVGGGGGSGDVVGPSSATDNAIARFDTTTGKLLQNSSATIDDTGAITAPDFVGDLNGAVRFDAKAIGSAILAGEVVYISGISGNTPEIQLAQSNSSATMPAFGIAIDDIPQNNTGKVATFGSVKGLDVTDFGETSIIFSIGDTVYVSSTEAGKLTNVPPSGETSLIQNIGKIERATPTTNMTIKVGGAGRTNATPNLDSAKMFLGNSSNQAASVAMSGDVTIDNTGATTVGTINSVAVATVTSGAALGATSTQPGDNVSTLTNDAAYLPSDPSAVTGADAITNIMSLTQAEYDAIITPNATTLYIIA